MGAKQPRVFDLMSGPLVTVAPDTSITEVDRLLAEHEISGVVVVEGEDVPVGVISRTDLLRSGTPRPGNRPVRLAPGLHASDLMQTEPICVDHKGSVRDAALQMARSAVHRVVAVDGTQAVGLLSVTDLMRHVASSDIDTPLSELASEAIASLTGSTSVGTATARLREAGVRAMLVVDDGGPAGVFGQAEALSAGKARTDEPVRDWMNPTVCLLPEDTPLNRAAGQAVAMSAPLVVVTRGGEPHGVLSASDLIYATL